MAPKTDPGRNKEDYTLLAFEIACNGGGESAETLPCNVSGCSPLRCCSMH